MSTLAVFVALGGGAYAAGIAKNSVKSKTIKDGSVKGIDVLDDTLTGADIDEGTLAIKTAGVASGDLSGSYPGPAIAGNAVTTGKIANNTIKGEDIDKATTVELGTGDAVVEIDGSEVTVLGPTGIAAWMAPDEIFVGNEGNQVVTTPGGVRVLEDGSTTVAGLTRDSGLILREKGAPPALTAGQALIYARENSGADNRTELVVQFADGDIDTLAIDAP